MQQTQLQQSPARKAAPPRQNGLTVECFPGHNGKLERKIERFERQFTEYSYEYDAKGHLTAVKRDGVVTERYHYNQRGQRVEQKREYRGFGDSTSGMLRYDEKGRLVRAGDTSFYYDKRGAMSERCDRQGVTKYFYGNDTLLDKVILPSGTEISYEYDGSNPAPARRLRNGTLSAEYIWSAPTRLAACRDHDNLLEYAFTYDSSGIVEKVRINAFSPSKQAQGTSQGGREGANRPNPDTDWLGNMVAQERRERLHGFLGQRSLPLELFCGCDQVGTLKLLTDKYGFLVKEVLRDSFGVQQSDSFPDLFMPIGFAGGLTDPDTGLVRFGYRDYDPSVGKFTALDPAKDRRGDDDLYDYCADDPVNGIDPAGLMGCRPQFRVEQERQAQTQPAQGQGAEQQQVAPAQPEPQEQAAPAQAQNRTQRPAAQAPAGQWDRARSIGYLQDNALTESGGYCARAVGRAIEAGGIRINRALNPTHHPVRGGSAYGYGPVLEGAGFRAMPEATAPEAGDVVVFPASPGHAHGHAAMFDGRQWISDFRQNNIYGSGRRERERVPCTIYRRP